MTIESRREFVNALGGQVAVQRALGVEHRQIIDNMVRRGFAHVHKKKLIALAVNSGVPVHPELLQGRKKKNKWTTTPVGNFVHELAKVNGGFRELAKRSGIPHSALRRVCLERVELPLKHVPALEKMAELSNVAIPKEFTVYSDKFYALTKGDQPVT